MILDFLTGVASKISGFFLQEETEGINDLSFLETEISAWKNSPERREQIEGFRYYEGYHDILYKKRMVIGKGGELQEVKNLPNRRDIDNQYAVAVDKKANYFLGKPISFKGENKEYIEILRKIFDKRMMRKLKNMAKKSMNGAIAWAFPYYDENGKFNLKVFPAYEIKAYWKDNEHEELDYVVRLYEVVKYKGRSKNYQEKVEIYKPDGIYRYNLTNGNLVPDDEAGRFSSYLSVNGLAFTWERIPLIPFKYNASEVPLIRRVKALQDAINELMSMFHNNMLEDARNTILVIENYDGQDLGEFRQNLSQYGAVKVRSGDGARGGVTALTVEVNAGNYQAILDLLKNALIENARSFDGKSLKSGTPNQMNILSMYQEIDIDTNDFETEYQAALEELLFFINVHLSISGQGDYFNETVEIIFNRDMLMNESEIMATLISAGVKISNRTLLSQVPFIDDVDEEIEQIKREQEEAMETYQNAFPKLDTGQQDTEED